MKYKQKTILIIALLALVLLMITPVCAETVTGVLGSSNFEQFNYDIGAQFSGKGTNDFRYIDVHNIEYAGNTISLVRFDSQVSDFNYDPPYGPVGNTTTFTGYVGSVPVVTGTFGYQRAFDNSWPTPIEIRGYQWITFSNWNLTDLSGDYVIFLDCERIDGLSIGASDHSNHALHNGVMTISYDNVSGNGIWGTYIQSIDENTYAEYTASSPSGIGIAGGVNKLHAGTVYNSRAYVYNASDGTVITNQLTVSADDMIFNIVQQPIIIGILSPSGIMYLSGVLFSSPIPPPVGNLTGVHNITFHVIGAGENIYNAHVSFAPATPGPVLTGHTNASGMIDFISVPSSASAIVDVTATGFPEYVETFSFTSDMVKTINLRSTSVTLYLDVKDSTYGYYLDDVTVGIKNATSGVWRNSTGSGSKYFDSTGATYEYPLSIGETVVLAASAPGYRSASETVTIPYDKYLVTLHMINLNGTAPSSGNFTAVIAAGSVTTGLEIIGASITIQELGRMSSTNQAGVATFRNVPVGTYTLSVSAPGYQSTIDSITGTDQETAMKRIRLMPNGCSQSETGTVSCNGTVLIPGGGLGSGATNQTANEKAAGGITAFLDNIIGIGIFVLILIVAWFIKKIFWS